MKGKCFIEPIFHGIVEGRITQFRQVMKPQPYGFDYGHPYYWYNKITDTRMRSKIIEPRYKVGETLYLQEPYCPDCDFIQHKWAKEWKANGKIRYKYAGDELSELSRLAKGFNAWSYNMLAKHARYFIEITGVKVERLQDISDEDCLREGVLEWVEDWVRKTYRGYAYDDQHWINDKSYSYDQSISYCRKCAEKEVKRLVKNYVKKGCPKDEAENDVWVEGGGGYGETSDTEQFCETCGKPLFYVFVGDIYEYMKDANFDFNKCFAFFLEACGYRKDWEAPFIKAGYLKKAFAAMIDNIKRGTWDSNPFVWVYEFKLIK